MKFIKYYISMVRIVILLLASYHIFTGDFKALYSLLAVFLLTFVPKLIKKLFNFQLSKLTVFLYIALVFSSSYLGRILNFYYTCWYFDLLQHFISGILFFDVAMSLCKYKKIKYKNMIFFAFCFSITFSTLWEVLEFITDFFFNTDHQHWKFNINSLSNINIGSTKQPYGLVDTMTDIISNFVGTIAMVFFSIANKSFYSSRKK